MPGAENISFYFRTSGTITNGLKLPYFDLAPQLSLQPLNRFNKIKHPSSITHFLKKITPNTFQYVSHFTK